MHNLTVEEIPTYYVMVGGRSALVHNCVRGTQRLDHSFDRHSEQWFGRPPGDDRDCTKETRQTRSGQDVTNYVTRVATVANEGGFYRVVDLDVEHQGDIFTAGYGCIPNPMATEATATTKTVVEGFLAAQADPRKGLPAAVDALVVDKLENPSKAGVFRDSLGFTPATLDPALRAHLIDNFGAATRPVPMVGGGSKFSVTGPLVGPSGQSWTITTAWGVDPNGTVRLITATP